MVVWCLGRTPVQLNMFIAQSSVNTVLRADDVNITADASWVRVSKAPSSQQWYPSLIMVLGIGTAIGDSPHWYLWLIVLFVGTGH